LFCNTFGDDENTHMTFRMKGATLRPPNWTVVECQTRLSEIIERAKSEGPQTITKKGSVVAVVVGAEEWQRRNKRSGSLAEFFAASPLRRSKLKVHRRKDKVAGIGERDFPSSVPIQSLGTPGDLLEGYCLDPVEKSPLLAKNARNGAPIPGWKRKDQKRRNPVE
jgi:prevent-host-death family protein